MTTIFDKEFFTLDELCEALYDCEKQTHICDCFLNYKYDGNIDRDFYRQTAENKTELIYDIRKGKITLVDILTFYDKEFEYFITGGVYLDEDVTISWRMLKKDFPMVTKEYLKALISLN